MGNGHRRLGHRGLLPFPRQEVHGDATISLGRFTVDGSGALDARFTIPEDYGGVHEVIALIDGKPVAQNGIEVTQSFEMTPASGPVGTPIELRVKGLGWRTMESTWVVNWDNNLVGFVSAAGTKGSAVARFRAAGPVGDHVVKVLTGYQGQGYLNHEQSPVAHLPRPQFTFQHDARACRASLRPTPNRISAQPVPKTEVHVDGCDADARSPTQGPVGTRVMLRGDGFPGEHVTAAGVADVRGQPRQRQRLRAEGDTSWQLKVGHATAASSRQSRFPTISAACTASRSATATRRSRAPTSSSRRASSA